MSREINLVGGFYQDDPWSSQDAVNWLPAKDESGQARSPMMLRGVPGLRLVTTSAGSGGGGGGGGIVVSPVVVSGTPPAGEKGVAYSFTFTATGGTGPYFWRTNSGQNEGLEIDPTTGELSGTPTRAGSQSFSVTARDSLGREGSVSVTLSVTAPLGPEVELINPDFATSGGWTTVNQTASPGFSFQAGAGRTGPGFLRWQSTAALGANYFGDTIANNAVVQASGNRLNALGFVRCTAATPSAGQYADILIGVQIFEDAACTIPASFNWQSFVNGQSVRFDNTRDWVALSLGVTPLEGQYYRLAFQCRTGIPVTVEFDDCSWDARSQA